ncbi:N-terminal domain of NEFA-interacting nuclear protein NIP30-domain-containing protein [Zopfochytrium polystomum]|nr:N-terminal domain of NEFA-interacting nuclear protein NIP30-domain-containing protein [Zopfochytrium polystomum]
MDPSAIRSRFVAKAVLAGDDNAETPIGLPSQGNQPTGPPAAPHDGRTLYDRLQEQRERKEEEFLQKTKLGNLIKKLEPDDVEFLREQEEAKRRMERLQQEDERSGLEEFRKQRRQVDAPSDIVEPVVAAAAAVGLRVGVAKSVELTDIKRTGSAGVVGKLNTGTPKLDGVVVRRKRQKTECSATNDKSDPPAKRQQLQDARSNEEKSDPPTGLRSLVGYAGSDSE